MRLALSQAFEQEVEKLFRKFCGSSGAFGVEPAGHRIKRCKDGAGHDSSVLLTDIPGLGSALHKAAQRIFLAGAGCQFLGTSAT